jgi:hypothetical protein
MRSEAASAALRAENRTHRAVTFRTSEKKKKNFGYVQHGSRSFRLPLGTFRQRGVGFAPPPLNWRLLRVAIAFKLSNGAANLAWICLWNWMVESSRMGG